MNKIIIAGILSVLLVWLCVGAVDYASVLKGRKPMFCIEISDGHYAGLGYSFDIITHPITGKNEYVFSLFGNTMESDITN